MRARSTAHGAGAHPDELVVTAGSVLATTLDLLRREEALSFAQIGDHTDAVAEIADAPAAVSDRLARDLTDLDTATSSAIHAAVHDLHTTRDALSSASSQARRCASTLYVTHTHGCPEHEMR